MKRAGLRLHTRSHTASASTILLVLVACLVAAGAAAWPSVASARTVARGLADPYIISMSVGDQTNVLHEIRSELGATYVRFTVCWALAEPHDPAITPYDPTSKYMTGVASAVSQAHLDGLKVMITFYGVPKWASAQRFWQQTGGYQPKDAMSIWSLDAFQAFCRDVAVQLSGQVYAYECWNEPNLALFLFPQTTAQSKNFAADLYVKMLRHFSAGIRSGDAGALRVAGATAPHGYNTIASTSPQRFAARIKATAGAALLFDAYSHHPYMPGASPRLWPEAAPGSPNTTVTLQNLGTLLKLFPNKPFFLTEYGVQTAPCFWFSGQYVNQITQANYLRRAYAFVARYPQVKLLMWYLLKDQSPMASPNRGFYTGLRTADGAAKRAWYVFARGNRLTLIAPASIKRGSVLTLTGQLSCLSVGGLTGKQLVVQRHLPGHAWSTVTTVYTRTVNTVAGSYTVRLSSRPASYYRVTWRGVVTSRTRYVAVN